MKIAIHKPSSNGQIEKVCEFCETKFFVAAYLVKKGMGRFCKAKCWGLFKREKFNYFVSSEGERKCRICSSVKPLTDFSPDNRNRKRTTICKMCKSEWMKNHRLNNSDHYRAMDLKKTMV